MKLFASLLSLAALPVLASLVGCAGSSEESADVAGDELNASARPRIELASTSDVHSVQATLFLLMDRLRDVDSTLGIESGVDSASLMLKGTAEEGVASRSVDCNTSKLIHAQIGVGASTTTFFHCTLDGFDKIRNGGSLPNVLLRSGESPLAAKLYALLAKGEQHGGFGVTKSGGNLPPCCDIPTTTTYSVSDANGKLSCSMHAGGFAFMTHAECMYQSHVAPNE
jgi:hypothetical protein